MKKMKKMRLGDIIQFNPSESITTILVCTLLIVACGGQGNRTKTSTITNDSNTTDDAASMEETKPQEINDLNNRMVFYLIWEESGEYRISKSQRIFIVENSVLIEEIPHEPLNYRIENIEYHGDSVIKIALDTRLIAWRYYSELLAGEDIEWYEIDDPENERTVTFTKNKSTYIWSYQNGSRKLNLIDTYDVLPSGYYYTNKRTTFHNPDKENFLESEQPVLKGVFDLNEKPRKIEVGTEEYNNMERPYEGTWLMITMTDIGYVVYDYPAWDDREVHTSDRHTPDRISVYDRLLTHMSWDNTLLEDNHYDEVCVYTKDGSFLFWTYNWFYSFKWIDKKKHIAQWTRYDDERIEQQEYYINKEYNNFPIIMYDWD
ncbi:MAG: hypothetical protein LBU83_02250 [Bacteroidales bacterium]|jgi:hypothetical protein|nr:hypothetical protein [Bacteroidales bacterium]